MTTIAKDDNVLLLFSGGFDSTATLLYLLQETDCNLDVLHFTFSSKLGKIENRGCNRIVEYCKKNYRTFNYHERLMDAFTTNVGMNITREESAKWCNAQLKKGKIYKYIAVGRCKIDLRGNFQSRAASAEAIFRKHLRTQLRPKTKFYFPILEWEKAKIVKYIPNELIGHVWTCQRPHPTKLDMREAESSATCYVPDTILSTNQSDGGYKIIRCVANSGTSRDRKTTLARTKAQRLADKARAQAKKTRDVLYRTENFRPCRQCSSCKDIMKLVKTNPEIKEKHKNFAKYA